MGRTGKRYTEAQIIAIFKDAEPAPTVGERSAASHTYYRWRSKYGEWSRATRSGSGHSRT